MKFKQIMPWRDVLVAITEDGEFVILQVNGYAGVFEVIHPRIEDPSDH